MRATKATWPQAPEWMASPLSRISAKALDLKRCPRCRRVKGKGIGLLWKAAGFYPRQSECKACRRELKKTPGGIESRRRYDASPKRAKVKARYLRTAAGQRSLAHTKAMRAAREQLAGPDPTMAEARALCDAFGNLCAFCSKPTTYYNRLPRYLDHAIALAYGCDHLPELAPELNSARWRLPSCSPCNRAKEAKLLWSEFRPSRPHPELLRRFSPLAPMVAA